MKKKTLERNYSSKSSGFQAEETLFINRNNKLEIRNSTKGIKNRNHHSL